MTDLTLNAKVSRTQLGLGDLNLNDHVTYAVSGNSLWRASRRWSRVQPESIDMHGSVTTHRKLEMASDPFSVYVHGASLSALDTALGVLLDAFSQQRYVLQQQVDGADHQWSCQEADVDEVVSTNAHLASRMLEVKFTILHYPIPLVGAL